METHFEFSLQSENLNNIPINYHIDMKETIEGMINSGMIWVIFGPHLEICEILA